MSLLLMMLAGSFAWSTRTVRFACNDDVAFQGLVSSGDPGSLDRYFVQAGEQQGRFYFALREFQLPFQVYRIRSPLLFSAIRTAGLFMQLGLWGFLVARLLRNEPAGWLYTVCAASALHIPAIYYPVLSYPTYSLGSICLALALHSYLSGLESPNPVWTALSASLMPCALIYHENFIVFTLLFPALALFASERPALHQIADRCLPVAIVSAAFITIYIRFRQLYSSGYGGTTFSFSVGGSLTAWYRQTFAAIPGVELLLNRSAPYPNVGPLLKSPFEIGHILMSVPPFGAAIGIVSALVAFGLSRLAVLAGSVRVGSIRMFALAAALPNILPSLTQKYQDNSHHRFYPYVYSFSSYCWGIAAVVGLWVMVGVRIRSSPRYGRIAQAGILAVLMFLFWSAQASNAHTLDLLRSWFN